MSISRRRFIKTTAGLLAAGAAGGWLAACGRGKGEGGEGEGRKNAGAEGPKPAGMARGVFVARGSDPERMVRAALAAAGGLGALIRPGATVAVKPNIAWDRSPEMGANTSPEVVAAVVRAALEAGAGRVEVFDRTVNDPRLTYSRSGVADAAAAAGAKVVFVDERDFVEIDIPGGSAMERWPYYRSALEADVLINCPVPKQHSTSGLTMAMKNTMGLLGGRRGTLHMRIHQALVDMNRPRLTSLVVMDALRILVEGGPDGGSPEFVRRKDEIIVTTDIVAADAYGAGLFGLSPTDLPFIGLARDAGLGDPALALSPQLVEA